MSELAFNLFYFVRGEILQEIGAVGHPIDSSDDVMGAKLRAAVASDHPQVQRFPLPRQFAGVTVEEYNALERLGRQLELYEPAFAALNASAHPLVCITAVVNGKIEIDGTADGLRLRMGPFQGHPKVGAGIMRDYMDDYLTPDGLDIPRLLNDDHFQAIRLLYNQRSYLACMKLLASFIDTVAFLEFGDVRGNFVRWLDAYTKVPSLGVTPAQLWELRNSLLHMSNLDSRKVVSGKVSRISFFVGPRGTPHRQDAATGVHFNLSDLIVVIADGLTAWLETFARDPDKLRHFVRRYDRIVRQASIPG
ncbi:hypothetical protein [Opitutus terrae]|uniref:Uncharacterized protein n=1 Tax=Opitutus terrae (strain DSM 11246 / JCM 15787 / PB90-1) TaxID=452637 RepID=B1ZQ19_OPITP|nr:hypothetical protein [Opitutus terrae]ACB77738.1 hypothetical protein Oter_4467 [Opitutus terrae PB90-1]